MLHLCIQFTLSLACFLFWFSVSGSIFLSIGKPRKLLGRTRLEQDFEGQIHLPGLGEQRGQRPRSREEPRAQLGVQGRLPGGK